MRTNNSRAPTRDIDSKFYCSSIPPWHVFFQVAKKWGSLPSAHLFSENEARVREGYGGTEQDNYADQIRGHKKHGWALKGA